MIANRRERILLIAAGVVVGGLILDSLWLTPLLEKQERVEKAYQTARRRVFKAESEVKRLPIEQRRLKRVEDELRSSAKDTAVIDLNQRLSQLAEDAGATTNTVAFERREKLDPYAAVVYLLELRTAIKALQKLLYLLDTSALPLKISNLTINKESRGDDLKVTLRVSMLTVESVSRGG